MAFDSSLGCASNRLSTRNLNALPMYVTLLALRPGSTWDAGAFDSVSVT